MRHTGVYEDQRAALRRRRLSVDAGALPLALPGRRARGGLPGSDVAHADALALAAAHPQRAFPATWTGRLLGGQDHSTVLHGVAMITADDKEGPPVMTTWTPARASSVLLFLSKQTATRYARGMAKKHDDPLYTTPRFTTTQAAELLGLKRATVYSAIQRGHLETALASPGTHLISQAAIDTYRAHHLGQVGHPTRQKQRRTKTTTEATGAPPSAEAPTVRERTHD
jgi:excisionase family DNA binding protein